MEDAATAEISRAQLWQWIHYGVKMADGEKMSESLYKSLRTQIVSELEQTGAHLNEAVSVLDKIVLDHDFQDFLTIPAYQSLTSQSHINQ